MPPARRRLINAVHSCEEVNIKIHIAKGRVGSLGLRRCDEHAAATQSCSLPPLLSLASHLNVFAESGVFRQISFKTVYTYNDIQKLCCSRR